MLNGNTKDSRNKQKNHSDMELLTHRNFPSRLRECVAATSGSAHDVKGELPTQSKSKPELSPGPNLLAAGHTFTPCVSHPSVANP